MAILYVKSGSTGKSHQIKEWFNEFTHVLTKLGTITAMGVTFWMLQGETANAATWNLTQTFNNPTPSIDENFSRSVAISGTKALIGAPQDDTGAGNTGATYLFDATTGSLLQTFLNPSPANSDFFGHSVAISGNNILVGAYGDDTGATDAGAAYLFDATTGSLLQTFLNPSPAINDRFGWSVDISGNNILVGAYGDDTGATNSGSAYLFDATTGSLLQTFLNPSPAIDDIFGWSVAISGNNVLVGASNDDTEALNSGAVYLFDGITGSLQQSFFHPNPVNSNYFGHTVAVSDNKVLVGSIWNSNQFDPRTEAYLFDGITGNLLHTFPNPTKPDGEFWGFSVAIDGDNVLIGAVTNDTGASNAGAAHLFNTTTGNLVQTFLNPSPAMNDLFGRSIAISGNNILIGADIDDTGATDSGTAYLFQPAQEPPQSVPEGDNVVGLFLFIGGYGLRRVISRLSKR